MKDYLRYNPKGEQISYLIHCEGMAKEDAVKLVNATWFYEELLQLTLRRICDRDGHNIRDTGFGTPDRGEMSGYCTRCGWSFRTILY